MQFHFQVEKNSIAVYILKVFVNQTVATKIKFETFKIKNLGNYYDFYVHRTLWY